MKKVRGEAISVNLSAEAIHEAGRSLGISTNAVTGGQDSVLLAFQWLDAQALLKHSTRVCYPLKHMIEAWGKFYVAQNDVVVAALMHPKIHGDYPCFNINSKLVWPDQKRLARIKSAGQHHPYTEDQYEEYYRFEEELSQEE